MSNSSHHVSKRGLLALVGGLALLLGASGTYAVDQIGEAPWIDRAHGSVVEALDDSANWFDRFFGDRAADTTRDASASLRVIFDGFVSGVEGEDDFDVRFRGSADLPRFENKLKLVITSDADAAITGEELVDEGGAESKALKDTTGGIGLAYLLRKDDRHSFGVSGGLKGGLPPDVYVNARYRYFLPLSDDSLMRLTETPYWKSDDGFGLSSLLEFERYPSADELWRYSLYGNYGEETDGLEWNTQATWLRRLDSKTAISTRLGVKGETDPREIVEEGWLTFRYRRNFYRPWLFYEIEPGLSWHIKEDYETKGTLALRLELQFHKNY